MLNFMKRLLRKNTETSDTHVIKSGTKIRFGLPSDIPEDLVAAIGVIIEQSDSLKDVYFGLQAIEGELSYILVLDLWPGHQMTLDTLGHKISVVLSEIKPDRSVDLVMATDFYRQAASRGSLLSCRFRRELAASVEG